MQFDEKRELSEIRLKTAEDCLNAAKVLVDSGNYKASANRSYYAVFHAMRAVLVFDDYDSKKHSGIISEFRKRYIKTGIFSSEISKIIDIQFTVRTHSDYDDFYMISEDDSVIQFQEAEKTVREIEKYLSAFYEVPKGL